MSREIMFTSAPRGIKPGSQGFCTVAHTQGMPANLIQQLESLSAYRHIFSPQDPKAALNPVVFSHLLLSLAGRQCHVLSRICDAGLDYSQRSNKFAHHVVLDAAEVSEAGPAWPLAQPGFMLDKWNRDPTALPPRPSVPPSVSTRGVCRAWQQVAGDAGWAGVLAETAANAAGRQAVLVFQPGMEILPLLAESLALLPAKLRWRVSFSTYYTKLPAGVGCQWRCVADGTPEAAAARRRPQAALVIDLFHLPGQAAGGAYVEAARTGKEPGMTATAESLADAELEQALQETPPTSCPAAAGLPPSPGIHAPYRDAALPPPSSQRMQPPRPQRFHPKRKTAPRWPFVLASAALIFLVVGAGVLVRTASVGIDKAPGTKADDSKPPADEQTKGTDAAKKAAEESARKTELAKGNAEQERAAQAKGNAIAAAEKATNAASAATQAAAECTIAACDAKEAAHAAEEAGAPEWEANVRHDSFRQCDGGGKGRHDSFRQCDGGGKGRHHSFRQCDGGGKARCQNTTS